MLNPIQSNGKPKRAKIMALALIIILIGGCASNRLHKRLNKRLNQVGINITRAELKRIMESKGMTRRYKLQPDGRIGEVWSYTRKNPLSGEQETSRFLFIDGKLVKSGPQEGDSSRGSRSSSPISTNFNFSGR